MQDEGEKPTKRQKRSSYLKNAKKTDLNNCELCDVGGNAQWNFFYIGANDRVCGGQSSKSHSTLDLANGTLREMDLPDERPAMASGSQNNISSRMQVPQSKLGPGNELAEAPPTQESSESETEASSDPKVMTVSPDTDLRISESVTWKTHDCEVAPIAAYASRAEMYTIMMLTQKAGYPLYMPEPHGGLATAYRKTGVNIGDVGVVTPNGAFDFLFNACDYPQSTNPAKLPDGFEVLTADIAVNIKFSHNMYLTSNHVNPIQDSPTAAFQCLAVEGAVLALPEGATVYEALNRLAFQKYAASHAVSWYKYTLERGRDYSNGSLYFVTECVKSRNWGIAAFYGKSRPSDYLRFMPLERSSHVVQAPYRWEHCGKVEPRIGPALMDVVANHKPNQCVFLRGFKIMLRQDIWDKLRSSIGVPSRKRRSSETQSTRRADRSARTSNSRSRNGTSASGNQGASTSGKGYRRRRLTAQQMKAESNSTSYAPNTLVDTFNFGRVILEENVSIPSPAHPSDLINVMLLQQNPTAQAAVTHDSEWCDILPFELLSDPGKPKFDGLLENVEQTYTSVVDEHDCASLVNSNDQQITSQTDLPVGVGHIQHDSRSESAQIDPGHPAVVQPSYFDALTLPFRSFSDWQFGYWNDYSRLIPTFNVTDPLSFGGGNIFPGYGFNMFSDTVLEHPAPTLNFTDSAKVDSSIALLTMMREPGSVSSFVHETKLKRHKESLRQVSLHHIPISMMPVWGESFRTMDAPGRTADFLTPGGYSEEGILEPGNDQPIYRSTRSYHGPSSVAFHEQPMASLQSIIRC